MITDFKKLEHENSWEYGLRLIESKVNGEIDCDWQDIVEHLELDCHRDSLRKATNVTCYSGLEVAKYYKRKIEEMTLKQSSDEANPYEELTLELEMKKREIFKEKVKLQDLRNTMRKEDRVEARWENAMEHLYSSIKSLPPIKIEFAKDNTGDAEACILISDTHFGKGVKTPHNEYNLEIAKERLNVLATQTIKYAKMHNVGVLNIDILGDLIENNLHLDAQVDQVCDAMEQVAYAGEFLSQFIAHVSPHFNQVRLHSVVGNHDRVERNYKDSRDVENYVRLIDTFIELRTGMKFERNNVDQEIEVYTLENGLTIALQHGHNVRSVDTLVKDVSSYLDMHIDYCHIGHFHSFKVVKGTIVNGSMCGSDKYANKLRFNDKASQVFVVYHQDGSQIVHNIILN